MGMVAAALCLLAAPMTASTPYRPSDSEVKVALQAVLVAAAATMGAKTLSPPVQFPNSTITMDSGFSTAGFVMDKADVGQMLAVVLDSPPPPPVSMGLIDLLRRSLVPFSQNYQDYVAYLKPQQVLEREIVFSGTIGALRQLQPFPIRYEGNGRLEVYGTRFKQDFVLEFAFSIPLEGVQASKLVPASVLANGYDYLHVAEALFRISHQ